MLPGGQWQALFDSTHPRGEAAWQGPGEHLYPLPGRSVLLFAALGHGLDP